MNPLYVVCPICYCVDPVHPCTTRVLHIHGKIEVVLMLCRDRTEAESQVKEWHRERERRFRTTLEPR